MNKIAAFLRLRWHDRLNVLQDLVVRAKTRLYYARVAGKIGKACRLYKPVLLSNPRFLQIGDHTLIRPGARLEILQTNLQRTPLLRIGSNTNIEQNVHIVCHNRIEIGSNVSITAFCAIVDTTHPIGGPKPGATLVDDDAFVEIGDGTFIGIGSVILPNVRVGKHCYIGANSVVTKSLPDYAVAAGSPARILRFGISQ